MFALALAGLLTFSPATTPPTDPVSVFEAWAAEHNTPVHYPACDIDGELVVCYGTTGDEDGGYDGVAVGVGVIVEGGEFEFSSPPVVFKVASWEADSTQPTMPPCSEVLIPGEPVDTIVDAYGDTGCLASI